MIPGGVCRGLAWPTSAAHGQIPCFVSGPTGNDLQHARPARGLARELGSVVADGGADDQEDEEGIEVTKFSKAMVAYALRLCAPPAARLPAERHPRIVTGPWRRACRRPSRLPSVPCR